MADRTVSVGLRAEVGGFVAGIRTAQANFRQFNEELSKSAKKRQALNDLGNVAGKIGLAAGAGLGFAIKKAADFDQAMSYVQAATHETAKNMDLLRQAALDAGQETVFSATESAGAVEALAKAGIKTRDILAGGLDGALSLAAAGTIDVGQAAEIASSAMSQFALSGKDVPHIADLLAAGAGKAQGEVTDLAMALNQSGLVAAQTGLSIEETTGALSAFAQAGLLGSDAGTSLKTMLLSLSGKSEAATTLIEKLGISAFNSKGEFIGLEKYAGKLREGLEGLTDEQRQRDMQKIFGTDAIRAANVLYREGAEGIGKWIKKVDDQGYAAETASIKLDNLKGDLEQLSGALETAFIGTGSGSQGVLRDLTQNLTGLVNAYNGAPQPIKDTTGALLGFVTIAGGSVYAFTKVSTGIGNMKSSLNDLGVSFANADKKMLAIRGSAAAAGIAIAGLTATTDTGGRSLDVLGMAASGALLGFSVGGGVGAAIGGTVGALAGFIQSSGDAADIIHSDFVPAGEKMAGTFDKITGAATQATRETIRQALAAQSALDNFGPSKISSRTLIDAIAGDPASMRAAREELARVTKILKEFEAEGTDHTWTAHDRALQALQVTLSSTLPYFTDQYGKAARAARRAAFETANMTEVFGNLRGEVRKPFIAELKAHGYRLTADQLADIGKKLEMTPHDLKIVTRILNKVGAIRDLDDVGHKADDVGRKQPNVKVTVDTGQANGALDGLWGRLSHFDNAVFTAAAVVVKSTEKRATGGPVVAGRPYVIGENGPELVTFGANGHVTSNRDARRMMVGGGTGGDRALSAELRFLRETVGRLETRLSRLGEDVRVGAATGSKAGIEGRMRGMNAEPYLLTGGI